MAEKKPGGPSSGLDRIAEVEREIARRREQESKKETGEKKPMKP